MVRPSVAFVSLQPALLPQAAVAQSYAPYCCLPELQPGAAEVMVPAHLVYSVAAHLQCEVATQVTA